MIACPKMPKPIISEKHTKFWVSQHRCVICTGGSLIHMGYTISQCGHCRIGWYRMGGRPCDGRTNPLCPYHHQDGEDAQHKHNEKEWWASHGLDPFALSSALARTSPDLKIRNAYLVAA